MYIYYFKDQEEINASAFARLSPVTAGCAAILKYRRSSLDNIEGILEIMFQQGTEQLSARGTGNRRYIQELFDDMEQHGVSGVWEMGTEQPV